MGARRVEAVLRSNKGKRNEMLHKDGFFCVHTCQGTLQKQLRVHSRVKKWHSFPLKHLRTCLPTESDTSPDLRSIDARARDKVSSDCNKSLEATDIYAWKKVFLKTLNLLRRKVQKLYLPKDLCHLT